MLDIIFHPERRLFLFHIHRKELGSFYKNITIQ
ncbi:hypothetical protein HDEF_0175 [Candidatus Hamiltonella defensa 5AT (Acyrthosiphon pisum)]|uniref:Uncharacterized protein n=1 Tax=Hamiltonella defensa subsp. Acyrthosiphon pisum (strain 5AT) TaxID=572265 RepID=C4K8W1_HAMD5|nr:hypothetical protein HDEF_0175 [Candidatus Hamiltonella defensa 5AT (Acyrthosiphon pisum)]